MLSIFAVALSLFVLYGDVLIARSHAEGNSEECKYPFRTIGDSCYFISKEKATADKAFALCLRRGAYLANFETLEETMLMKYELQLMKTGLHFHVGGRNINRYVPDGDWRWIQKGKMNKMTYKAFGARQPERSNSAPQDCMMFYAGERYTFHDVYCDHPSLRSGYICEK
ncbi:C-type lectin domain family 6 member A-like [Mytilus edulis]|uniref:C-type lectin domain family 6 member A-like n=1 Tax=Mytilus edulis TaxID=6550 RepID=UPI0039F0322A